MKKYPVYERFISFQGEGVHMGRRAFFIRLYGCDQKCPWCDSAGTWHPEYRPASIPQLTLEELVQEAAEAAEQAEFFVITGGEPALYDLRELTAVLRTAINRPIHVETAGHHSLKAEVDWLTLSPKLFDGAIPVRHDMAFRADEIKFIIEHPEDIDKARAWLDEYGIQVNSRPVWLHPEWGHHHDAGVLNAISIAVIESGFRAGYQLHKLYMVDNYDSRARKDILPLGGDPRRGPAT